MDVQARSIQWCQQYLARAHPTVQFRHLNVHNLRYNPSGERLDASFRFPFPERSFDLIYLYSVFSHMMSADIRVYLHDFQRLLVRTGWVCFTGFLEEGVPEGTTPINRGELSDGLKTRGSFGHPSQRDVPVRARSRREEASDEPADPMLPQSGLPSQRPGGAGEHSCA
jgi:SAM-dependent methyltransferase